MSSIRRAELENGVTVTYRHIPDVKTFGCIISSRAGSRNEAQEYIGITHLAEHIIFEGNDYFPEKNAINREIQRLGDKVNASTGTESVLNHGVFAAEDALRGFKLLSEIFFKPTFPDAKVDQEKEIVLNEIKQYNDNHFHFCYEQLNNDLWSGELKNNTLGDEETVSSITRDNLYEWWTKNVLNGSNIIISAYGNMSFDSFLNEVRVATSHLSKGSRVQSKQDQMNFGIRNTTNRDTDLNYTAIAFSGRHSSDPLIYRLNVLCTLCGGSMNSILWREIREKMQAAYQVGTWTIKYNQEGAFYAYAYHDADKPAEEKIIDILNNIDQFITQDDFDSAVQSIVSSTIIDQESNFGALWTDNGNEHSGRKHMTLDERIANYKSITIQDVIDEAKVIFEQKPSIHTLGRTK